MPDADEPMDDTERIDRADKLATNCPSCGAIVRFLSVCNECSTFVSGTFALKGEAMTLLERWDRTDHKETINSDEIRRAFAIAQAVEEATEGDKYTSLILERADELLKEGK